MQRSSTQSHGVITGLILALGVAAFGFLMQADLAKILHGGGKEILAGGVLLGIIAFVFLRIRGK